MWFITPEANAYFATLPATSVHEVLPPTRQKSLSESIAIAMSLTLHGDVNTHTVLSPAGIAAANDLLDLGLEPLAALDDDDGGVHVRAAPAPTSALLPLVSPELSRCRCLMTL